jgi:hypothetical protein
LDDVLEEVRGPAHPGLLCIQLANQPFRFAFKVQVDEKDDSRDSSRVHPMQVCIASLYRKFLLQVCITSL